MLTKMIRIFSAIFILLCSGFSINVFAAEQAPQNGLSDRVVAIVDKDVITQSSLDHQVNVVKLQLKGAGMSIPKEALLRKNILDQMIDRKLQLQSAQNAGIRVDSSELDSALNHIAQQNGMTLSQLYDSVQKDGWSVAEFKQEIQEEMIVEKLLGAEFGSKIKVTPKEVDDFLAKENKKITVELYHLQDIYIPFKEKASEAVIQKAKRQAMDILKKLGKGDQFKQIAIKMSQQDPNIKVGDLGWRPLSSLPPIFEPIIAGLKSGQITKPIQVPNGFHIMKLVEAPKVTEKPAVSSEQAQQILFQQKINDATKKFLEQLRAQAYIKVLNGG